MDFVQFDDPNVGSNQRRKYSRISKNYQEVNGTPIFKEPLEYQLGSRNGFSHTAKAKLRQFPLRLAYAMTAHKMQVCLLYLLKINFMALQCANQLF